MTNLKNFQVRKGLEVDGAKIETIKWQSSIQTDSNFASQVNKAYWVDTTSNSIKATLPTSASVGDEIIFADYARKWNTNNFLIDNKDSTTDPKFQGVYDSDTTFSTDGTALHIVYSGATQGWIPITDNSVTQHAVAELGPVEIEMLIEADGGGGGGHVGGGGGAGGYRTSTQTIDKNSVIVVAVGGGGAGGQSSGDKYGVDGSNSSVTSTGNMTLITSTGGGGGGGHEGSRTTGADGGSGGGGGSGGNNGAKAGGSGNTPSTSPSQGNDGGSSSAVSSLYNCGGGGGAGAAGANGDS